MLNENYYVEHRINLIFPQRVYIKQSYDDGKSNPKEWISYWDYMLIWEDDFSIPRRARTLLGCDQATIDLQKIESISAKEKAEKVIVLPEAESRNRKVQDRINELQSKAEEDLKKEKEFDLMVAKGQIALWIILFILTVVTYSYVYIYLY